MKSPIEHVTKNNLDVLILKLLKEQSLTGKDITKEIHDETGCLISSGRLYPLLHEMEDNSLLSSDSKERRDVKYNITENGRKRLEDMKKVYEKLLFDNKL